MIEWRTNKYTNGFTDKSQNRSAVVRMTATRALRQEET
ncbi:hypothetical protein PAN31108_02328 [Pandoraea anhela]|uniref:Uncharacterized protein n=1 Tax=Pandoraea anhela TaxID=2508295 RepID=A0A5E4V0H8_9BURK|nr:hypothetical protein PAN31108_02328 [Pandoraea anhela]